jgi:poly(3-hydroxybutyrate) depolymerase
VVFLFHGLGGDGAQIRSYLGLEAEAAGQALMVYPDGRVIPSAGRTAWEVADLAFFDAMVSEVSAAYCVDPSRIFAAGHSYGAYMTNVVGCQRGDVVRAIAAVSGGALGGTCRRPLPVWLAHGDADQVVPQSEGIAARDQWRATNGCSSNSVPTTPAPCVSYVGCAADAPVTWCSFSGNHYPLPAYTRPAIWDFFRAW